MNARVQILLKACATLGRASMRERNSSSLWEIFGLGATSEAWVGVRDEVGHFTGAFGWSQTSHCHCHGHTDTGTKKCHKTLVSTIIHYS